MNITTNYDAMSLSSSQINWARCIRYVTRPYICMRNAFSLVRSNGDPSVSKDQSLDTVYLRVILMVIGHIYVFYDTLMVETHLNDQSLVRC